jgi:hypothetical protein
VWNPIRNTVFIVVALLVPIATGCGRRSPAVDAAAAPPATPEVSAAPDASAEAGYAPCRPAWILPPDSSRRVLDGAFAGGEAALLLDTAAGPRLLLIAGEYAEAKAVALSPDDPAGTPAAGSLVGAVASYGDRFLVAWGRIGADGLALRLRAVMPAGRILPVNAPGRPGAEGGPALRAVPSQPGAQPTVMLHGSVGGVILAVSWDRGDGSTYVVLTPTGAPSSAEELGWSLVPAVPGAAYRWQVVPALADSAAYRYVGPVGSKALAVDEERGVVLLVVPGAMTEPFPFADGWVPAAGEPVWFSPQRVLRLEPGTQPSRAVAYDGRGAVAARLELPDGDALLAVARDAETLLVRDSAGGVLLCGTRTTDETPRTVDPGAALAGPSTGMGTCGR